MVLWNLINIDSDNSLSPGQYQAITKTNADLLAAILSRIHYANSLSPGRFDKILPNKTSSCNFPKSLLTNIHWNWTGRIPEEL